MPDLNSAVSRSQALARPSTLEPLPGLFQPVDLSIRRQRPEWMDQPDVDPRALDTAHRCLKVYNWLSLTHRTLWNPIRLLARQRAPWEIRVLDVGCGGGEMAISLAKSAQRARLKVTVDGCDLSPTAVASATQSAARAGLQCRFFQFDAAQDEWPADYDVICSSLFLHHLPTPLVETVLSHMACARQMVLANDMIRSHLDYAIVRFGTLLVTRSPLARYDGPISVAGAFTPAELQQMARRAGLHGATVRRCWLERMLLTWHKC